MLNLICHRVVTWSTSLSGQTYIDIIMLNILCLHNSAWTPVINCIFIIYDIMFITLIEQ